MKQLEVQIMGQSYLLGSPEGGEERLLQAVERVDSAMCRIRDAGKVKARDRIAVLAALNLAFDLTDRPTVPVADPEASTTTEPANNSPSEEAEDPRLGALLRRLDTVLGEDGRLL